MTRRTVLKNAIKLFFFLLTSISLTLFSLFAYPRKFRKRELVYFYFGDEESLPRRGVRQVYVKYTADAREVQARVFIVNNGDELFALSPVCSHLGCLVNWNRPKNRFLCPCHGGEYDINGQVVAGPPPAPLSRLPMEIRDGKAYVGLRV